MSEEEKKNLANSKKLEEMNKKDNKRESAKVKLLLLGAGESGKSTIFKQLKILYGKDKGYTSKERDQAKPYIYNNIMTNMKAVIDASEVDAKELNALAIADDKPAPEIDAAIAKILKDLWVDPKVQETWKAREKLQVQDALQYFMDDIDRIAAPGWVPTEADILRSRVRTTGIQEEEYEIDNVTFAIFDVGGQRNERKKWIHCFDQVTAVIFVAAMSEYNQVLYEDNTVNRITEALVLFEEIANSKWFKQTSMILFLNKKDLFAQKITQIPFRVAGERFDDFKGPYVDMNDPECMDTTSQKFDACYQAASTYLKTQFLQRNKASKEVYVHITCATDTRNVEVVFNACKDIILKSNLSGSGFM